MGFATPQASALPWGIKALIIYTHSGTAPEGFYLLPGGGVEEGESYEEALIREVHGEIGCDVKVMGKLATAEEYRDKSAELYKTECFAARILFVIGSDFVNDTPPD